MMHRVRRDDESQPRDMRRTTVAGNAPIASQVQVAHEFPNSAQLATTVRIAASMISSERSISAWEMVSGGATRHTQ
jgi:hypothetical protein